MPKNNRAISVSSCRLLEYVEREQIAYKFGDGLLKFTEPQTSRYDCEEDEKDVQDLMWYIENGEDMRLVKRSALLQDDLLREFHEIAEWASEEDYLINIEGALVICISAKFDFSTLLLS